MKVVDGLEEDEGFSSALEYGSMWHEMEEANAKGKDPERAAGKYRDKLRSRFPGSEASIIKWFKIAKRQFPIYLKHWKKHPDTKKRKNVAAEVSFRVPYQLPSGRWVLLRGKWDWVFKEGSGLWLMEHKTKGRIDEVGLQATVHENLQTMLYLIALLTLKEKPNVEAMRQQGLSAAEGAKLAGQLALLPVKGVVYNVVKRPLSDQHAIKQRKGREVNKKGPDGKPIKKDGKTVKIRVGAETEDQFLDRLAGDIRKDPESNFMRWKATIGKNDVARFKRECFDPILEDLLDWWEWVQADPFNPFRVPTDFDLGGVSMGKTTIRADVPGGGIHWRFPWGVYHNLASGFRGDFFEFLTSGRRDKLVQLETLFPELKDD